MFGYVQVEKDKNDKEPKEYYCVICGALISESGALIQINGSHNHSFVNPAGVRCNFTTFVHCENVLVHEDLYIEHSWFPGYGWRFLLCRRCYQHLGWKWDPVGEGGKPDGFFGLLINSVQSAPTGMG